MLTVVVTLGNLQMLQLNYSHFSKNMVHFYKKLPVIGCCMHIMQFFILTVYDLYYHYRIEHDQYELLTFNLNKCNCKNYVGNNLN